MTQDEFKASVREADAENFVRDKLFDVECWLFEQAELVAPDASYQKFRRAVADLTEINSNEVNLVGSSKFGFSMSPIKAWRPFNPAQSDLDCAIVSPELYRDTVDAVRRAYFEGYSHLNRDHANQIFAGHIVLSTSESYKSAYLKDAARRLMDLQKVASKFLRFEPDVKYRIYESFRVAEAYHSEGVRKLQNLED